MRKPALAAWQGDTAYRYGARLYVEGFFWEAHEVWEAVWKAGEEGRWSKELLTSALSRSDTPQGFTVDDGRTQDLVASGEDGRNVGDQ